MNEITEQYEGIANESDVQPKENPYLPPPVILNKLRELVHQKKEAQAERERIAHMPKQPYIREEPRIGRNDPCPCGSGKKYKKCCMKD